MTHAPSNPEQRPPGIGADDPVAALFINYFAASVTIRETVAPLWACRGAITNPHERAIFKQSRLCPFLGVWEASLHPVITGFKKLRLRDERVETLIEQHLTYIRATAKVVHGHHDHATYIAQSKQLSVRHHRGETPNLDTVTLLHDALEEFFSAHMFAQGHASIADVRDSESAQKH